MTRDYEEEFFDRLAEVNGPISLRLDGQGVSMDITEDDALAAKVLLRILSEYDGVITVDKINLILAKAVFWARLVYSISSEQTDETINTKDIFDQLEDLLGDDDG